MKGAAKRLILLDGMALLYRGHFALLKNPRLTSKGMNTSCLFVFVNSLLDLIKRLSPTHIAVVFDRPEPTFRHEMFKEYKAQREAMPEGIAGAIPYVHSLCEAMNIRLLELPGWEADDIAGTLSRMADAENFETYLVTSDKDYAQLVSERTFMYKPAFKGGGFDKLGPAEILKNWEIDRVEQVIDILGLMGDASDNVPGVPGVGLKTAQKLIREFGSVEGVIKNGSGIKGKIGEKIKANKSQALLSRKLVTINRQAPLDISLNALKTADYNDKALKALFLELEFKTLGKRLFGEGFESEMETELEKMADVQVIGTIEETIHKYRLVETQEDRKNLLKNLLAQKSVCFDLETTGLDPKSCHPIGIAFSWKPRQAWYLSLPDSTAIREKILKQFAPFFENETIEKIGHNLKFDLSVLRWQGVPVKGPFFDTLIAAFLTMPDVKRNMNALSEQLLGYRPVSITSLIGAPEDGEQKNMKDVPVEQVVEYAGEDADITFQLSEVFRPLIEETGQTRVFYELECPLLSVLVDMEFEGIRLDSGCLAGLSSQLTGKIGKLEKSIHKLAGEKFNIGSPKQLGDILFDKLKLDAKARKTQKLKQYATNEQVLSRLSGKHPIVKSVLDYRMLSKLKSTYIDALPGAINPVTGRVHTSFEQAVSATGRLQSNNPNLQNIPIRSALGKEVRKAFISRSRDFTLLSADYSQVELRIAAELSGDEALLEAFQKNLDIHTATAMQVYGAPLSGVTKEMRSRAKMVNFGILYGISAFGLSDRMNIPREESKHLIDMYFTKYPGVRHYLDRTIEFAHAKGYVETITGRRRYLRDINSKNLTTQKGAERMAINSPIQGTAADLIKMAMINIHRELNRRRLRSRLILQVHDELVVDTHKKEIEEVVKIVEQGMTTAIPMKVPLLVETGHANNWLEAH